ncbi:hypothetical protein [Piscinibacter sakaiensis]|uniref:Uncharacterized protein n=2 Tax=Piscinibacter sakaiensis TaxID=1547922 RepID=A0A0K8P8P1_PISS1|nr:hypothetical protein [Piscinibacter sakaiensis]GAP38560.1 hypothetical protein ISF6_5018 [Piscinibacter sakaiensis]
MPYNDRLFQLLGSLEPGELQAIWEKGFRRKPSDEEFEKLPQDLRVSVVSAHWRAIHGHSLPNLWRDSHELPWKRILIDVADKLKPGLGWTPITLDDATTEQALERMVLEFFEQRVRTAWAALPPEEQTRLASQLDAEMSASDALATGRATEAGITHVTATSLAAAIGSGLVTGAGVLALATGTTTLAVGGLLGGTLYQIGLWLVVRMFGVVTGAQLVASGGAAAVGGALLSAPAAAAFVAHAAMSTAYRKTIPATLMLLCAHELRRQLAELE